MSESGLGIEFRDVDLVSHDTPRLSNVSWKLKRGTTALLGKSGAGKTSLLNLIARLELPTSGGGSMISQAYDVPIYWAPQSGGLWPHWNVCQHLEQVLANSPESGKPREKTDELLSQFDLLHRQKAFPDELSMGEKSRLAVARALAVSPGLLVMDEPLAHVDGHRRNDYWMVIDDHLKATEASLVFSTHEPADAIAWSDHALCLDEGIVAHEGPTTDLYHRPPSERAGRFLGPLNWFEPSETSAWLQEQSKSPTAARPEALVCVSDESSPLKLLSSVWYGAYSESIIEDVRSGESRTIFHRPFANGEAAPENVRLKVTL